MKRKLALFLLLSLLITSACAAETAPAATAGTTTEGAPDAPAFTAATEPETGETLPAETATEAGTETEPEEETPAAQPLGERTLREMIDRNLTCVLNVFELTYLYYDRQSQPTAGGLYRVSDPRFTDYAELDEFVRKTYVKETADRLLLEERSPGHTLYVNVDGALYIDPAAIGGKGYYVDWSGYSITITEQTAERCAFKVTAPVTYPGDHPVPETYEKEGEAVLQGGVWLLKDAIY